MKRFSILAALLLVSACGGPLTPTASPGTTQPVATAASAAETNTAGPPTETATAATNLPTSGSDLFAQNDIALEDPTCDGSFTPEQTEGPYYKSGSPEDQTLYENGMAGTRLIVVGYVLDGDCQAIPGALLDFWQADGNGNYDNQGYTLRGHQYTNEQGRYFLETVIPGEYPGRTQHIHVKVQAPGGQVITSQLYFPGSGGNTLDPIYTPATQVTVEDRGGFQVAYYDFVLDSN